MCVFETCPRCQTRSFERLKTYSHCCECLYFEDYWSCLESDVLDAFRIVEELERIEREVETESFMSLDFSVNEKKLGA